MAKAIYNFVVLAGLVTNAELALAQHMSAEDLRKTFAGKTVYLSAPFGALPIRYSSGGSMVAQSRAMGLFSGISRDEGSWWIQGSQFCQRWKVWLSGKTQCFTVKKAGATLNWTSNDGMSGTARAAN